MHNLDFFINRRQRKLARHYSKGVAAGGTGGGSGAPATITGPLGQQAAATSVSVALANEDVQDLNITGQAAQTASGNNIILAVAGTGATDANGYRSWSIEIVPTGTVSSGLVSFEGSNDNVNFSSLEVSDLNSLSAPTINVIIPLTGSPRFVGGAVNMRYLRARISTIIGGGGSIQAFTRLSQVPFYSVRTFVSAVNIVTPGTANNNLGKAEDAAAVSGDTGVSILGIRTDTMATQTNASGDYTAPSMNKYGALYGADYQKNMPTYRGVANITIAAAATDIAILPGNATNTVFVTKVIISGTQTSAGEIDILLIKRSAANTAGTSGAITSVPLDSADSAASSLPLSYTANPTPGATVGTVDRRYCPISPAATGTSPSTTIFDFGERGKEIKLSGVAQGLAINLNGATVTGGVFTVAFEWREEP